MKKLVLLLLLTPLSLFACGMLSYIALPNSSFLTQTEDMDHSVILDLVDGKESMYMNLKSPEGVSSGKLLTVTPVPAEASTITVEEITAPELPASDQGTRISFSRLFENTISSSFFQKVLGFTLPLLFVVSLIALVALLIIIRKKQKGGIASSGKIKFALYVSATVALLLPVFILVLLVVFNTLDTVNTQSISSSGMPTKSPGMILQEDDHVTISYSTTTKRGTTLQVISAENGQGLTNYLERNGLPKQADNENVFGVYVEKKMNFVITQTDISKLPEGEKSYTHVQFPSETIFFPLGVNYHDSDEKHPVEALVLKPVTVSGFSTDLSKDGIPKPLKNKTLTYYKEGPNYSTRVHFFDEERNYNHDITMNIGKSSKLILAEFITKSWTLFTLFVILFALLVSTISLGVSKLPKILRVVYVLLPLVLISLLTVAIIFFSHFPGNNSMLGM